MRSSGARPDRYADARALVAGNNTIRVQDVFIGDELDAARASTDTRVRAAIAIADTAVGGPGRAGRVWLTQHMAGVPALLDFIQAASTLSPPCCTLPWTPAGLGSANGCRSSCCTTLPPPTSMTHVSTSRIRTGSPTPWEPSPLRCRSASVPCSSHP